MSLDGATQLRLRSQERVLIATPVLADGLTIYAGSYVNRDSSDKAVLGGGSGIGLGFARCSAKAAASGNTVTVQVEHNMEVLVTLEEGTSGVKYGDIIYAIDENTFSTSSSGNTAIGYVTQVFDEDRAWVFVESIAPTI